MALETAIGLMIALSVLHYAVVFYGTMAVRLAAVMIRLAGRRNPLPWRRGGQAGASARVGRNHKGAGHAG